MSENMFNNPTFDASSYNTPRPAIPSPGQAQLPPDQEANMYAQLKSQFDVQSQVQTQMLAQMQMMFQLMQKSYYHPDLANNPMNKLFQKPEKFSGQGKSLKEFSHGAT